MSCIGLRDYQLNAVEQMHNGCILNGGVGSGKSRTALAYYYKEYGGDLLSEDYTPMQAPPNLYIITTARKRDTKEWEGEMCPFLLSSHEDANFYKGQTIVVDSWNNISKYDKVHDAFFIFDEDRVTGKGKWVKCFLHIVKNNRWIVLSATPGDKWDDYIPVFIANGFYKNRTEFTQMHMIVDWSKQFPIVKGYLNTRRLERLRDRVLVDMDFNRPTVSHHEMILTNYDIPKYKAVTKTRWNPYRDAPVETIGELCQVWRRIVNEDESRQVALLELFEKHPRMIIFYNFNHERDILLNLYYGEGVEIAEWNGYRHQEIPESDSWVYIVQYNAGSEGWNCIKTDTIVFYSENYSYKMMEQARGRIDRMNTPYLDLYYYHMTSKSPIEIAIQRALKEKKTFNEGRFVEKYYRRR